MKTVVSLIGLVVLCHIHSSQLGVFSVEFLIKNTATGKYVHPKNNWPPIPQKDPLVLHGGHHNRMHYVFEPVDGLWGYIRHSTTGKNWHPKTGRTVPKFDTNIVLHSDRGRHALFALDQVNQHITHRDGLHVHYKYGNNPYPHDGNLIVLHSDIHEYMKWTLVNPNNPSEEVYPYGSPKIVGDWKRVLVIENPLAKHTYTYKYKKGKSHTESSKSSFQFKFETTVGANVLFAKASSSISLTNQIESSSSDTWGEEIEVTNSIEVEAGKTVAVWQKVFIGTQYDHKAMFRSSHFAHTGSIDVKPED